MENYFETDLEGIKNQLITYLKTQETFKDYNFEGSAINNLLNILAYTSQYQNLYLNFVSNELFLPTAQLEQNIYKNANSLNYIPRRKSSSYIDVNLQRSSAVNIIIPKYSTWKLGSVNLVNLEDINITTGSVYSVRLYEGTIDTETFTSDGSGFQEYTLSNRENIDNDVFYVYVDAPDGLGDYIISTVPWVNANTEGFNTGDNAFYILYFESMSLKFDDGELFNYPQTDERLRVVYLNTSGSAYNGSTGTVVLSDENILNKEELNILTTSTLRNGTDEESTNAIKSRAPLFYTTQNRAITESDHNILLQKYSKYDIFHSGLVWGGEKEYVDQNGKLLESSLTKDLGHVYISALKSDYSYLDTNEIDDIFEYMDKFKILSLFFRFAHPNQLTIEPIVSIKYNSVLDLNLNTMETQINDFLTSNDGFNRDFYLSDVIRFVDSVNDVVYCTVTYNTSVTVYNEDHKVIRLFNAIEENSITGTVNGLEFIDNGSGDILWDSVVVGSVNYASGFITLDQDFGVETYSFSFDYVEKNALNLSKETFLKHSNITLNII